MTQQGNIYTADNGKMIVRKEGQTLKKVSFVNL